MTENIFDEIMVFVKKKFSENFVFHAHKIHTTKHPNSRSKLDRNSQKKIYMKIPPLIPSKKLLKNHLEPQ